MKLSTSPSRALGRLAFAVIVVSSGLPSSALAAWSETLLWQAPDEYHRVRLYDLAYTPTGTAIALWNPKATTDRAIPLNTGALVATRPRDGAFTPGRKVVPWSNVEVTGSSVDRRSRVVVAADVFKSDSEGDFRVGVRAYRGRLAANGRVAMRRRAQVLSRRASMSELHGNARGDAVVVWRYGRFRESRGAVRAALSRGGRAFQRSTLIARGPALSATTAMNDSGDAVAVWQEGARIYARVAPRSRRFGRRLLVGRASPDRDSPDFIDTDVNAAGDVVVAWARRDGTSTSVVVAQAAAGRRFTPEVVLDSYALPPGALGTVPAVAATGHENLVAWNGLDLKVASISRQGITTETVEQGTMSPAELAARTDGAAAVAWETERGASPGAYGAIRTAEGRFGPPELVAGPDAAVPRPAFDPITGEVSMLFRSVDADRLAYAERRP